MGVSMISTNNKALYRKLSDIEIEALKDRGNSSDNWENITVKEGFDPIRINNSTFIGNIQIGIFTDKVLLNENLKHYFYGTNDNTLHKIKKRIEMEYPNAKVLGYRV